MYKVLLSTRQPQNLCKLLTTAKFERLPIPKQIKQGRIFSCTNCNYHRNGFFKECLSFSFKSKNKLLTCHYIRFFSREVKMFYMFSFAIVVTFSILDKFKN